MTINFQYVIILKIDVSGVNRVKYKKLYIIIGAIFLLFIIILLMTLLRSNNKKDIYIDEQIADLNLNKIPYVTQNEQIEDKKNNKTIVLLDEQSHNNNTIINIESETNQSNYSNKEVENIVLNENTIQSNEPTTFNSDSIINNDIVVENDIVPIQSQDNVDIFILENTLSSKGASLCIVDKNVPPYAWEERYSIEMKSNESWNVLKSKDSMIFNSSAYMPDENGQLIFKMDWSKFYGELLSGTYRIVKSVYTENKIISFYSNEFKID